MLNAKISILLNTGKILFASIIWKALESLKQLARSISFGNFKSKLVMVIRAEKRTLGAKNQFRLSSQWHYYTSCQIGRPGFRLLLLIGLRCTCAYRGHICCCLARIDDQTCFHLFTTGWNTVPAMCTILFLIADLVQKRILFLTSYGRFQSDLIHN